MTVSSEPATRRSTIQLLICTWFTADVRSVAAMRIGVALVVLYDLAKRARDLTAHYTDAGILPREVILAQPQWADRVSLHLLGGSQGFQATLFAVAAIFGAMLLVGYRTRLATIVSFVLLASLQARAPVILFGGDLLLKMMLFWGIFLPWGDAFSFDARRVPESMRRRAECSGGMAAWMIQVGIVYLVTATLKTGDDWHPDYTAIYYALSLEAYTSPLGAWVRQFPAAMKALTFMSYWIEMLAPLLMFFPIHTRRMRVLAVLLLVGLHLGIVTTMWVNFFPFINIVSLLIFLPSGFWDALTRTSGERPTIGEPTTERPWRREPRHLVPLVLACYVLFLNVPIPDFLRAPGQFLQFQQGWNMFSPVPLREGGWWAIEAQQADGTRIDLLRDGAAAPTGKPPNILRHYGGTRWRKFYRYVLVDRDDARLGRFHEYYCNRWNDAHESAQRVDAVELIFNLEKTLADHRRSPPTRVSRGVRTCPD